MALTYIKETHATHGVTYEVALCPACFAGLPDFMKTPHGRDAHGYRLEVRPWTGPADGECTQCDTLHSGGTGAGLASEFRGLPVKALLLCALLLTPALAQAALRPRPRRPRGHRDRQRPGRALDGDRAPATRRA